MPQTDIEMHRATYRESLVRNIEESGFLLFKAMLGASMVLFMPLAAFQDERGMVLSALAFGCALVAVFLQYVAAQLLLAYQVSSVDWADRVGLFCLMAVFASGLASLIFLALAFLALVGGVS